ncbi:hypothetical protein DXG01_008697 [Tephrocybe rancida]|nr:hypothetical protein DXG01_008697 [Tephrocybe rancida]
MPPVPQQACTCGMPGRDIEVIVVHFDNLEKITLTICPCSPAPQQLIRHGCFASAPLEPTLAVDFKVLDFVSTLFLHVAPNNTGWTDTVETFLAKQGYKLAAEGSLQKRFGNALVWYNVLQDATTRHIDQVLCIAHRNAIEIDDGMDISQEFEEGDPLSSLCVQQSNPLPFSNKDSLPESPQDISPPQSPQTPLQSPCTPHHHPTVEDNDDEDNILIAGLKCGRNEEDIEETEPSNPFPDPTAHVRPSDYLRAQCPLCFGGEFPRACPEHERPDDNPDTIVCIDACFTQKRNRQARDPPRTHPCTIFIPEQDSEAMEKYVDFIGSKKAPAKKRINIEEPDHLKGSLRVPKSVLDGCEAGFTAADSCREKASTQFFDDTALMALLCHYDVVLFIANM